LEILGDPWRSWEIFGDPGRSWEILGDPWRSWGILGDLGSLFFDRVKKYCQSLSVNDKPIF